MHIRIRSACEAFPTGSVVSVLALTAYACSPDPRANTTSYYLSQVFGSSNQFLLESNCTSSCGSCLSGVIFTLDQCVDNAAESSSIPSTESWQLTATSCPGGVGSSPASVPSGAITVIQSLTSTPAPANATLPLYSILTSLGTPGSCVQTGAASWAEVQQGPKGRIVVWWACDSADCTNCIVSGVTIPLNQTTSLAEVNGQFQFVATSSLHICNPSVPTITPSTSESGREGLSSAAVAGIAAGCAIIALAVVIEVLRRYFGLYFRRMNRSYQLSKSRRSMATPTHLDSDGRHVLSGSRSPALFGSQSPGPGTALTVLHDDTAPFLADLDSDYAL